jgi:hypothetical protein
LYSGKPRESYACNNYQGVRQLQNLTLRKFTFKFEISGSRFLKGLAFELVSEINVHLFMETLEQLNQMNKFYTTSNWFLIIVTVISSWAAVDACGQDVLVESALPLSLEWSNGSILTNDGTELKGLLKYNDKSGLLFYENGKDTKTLTARKVVGFEFFDQKIGKQRVFYSFPYEDSKNNVKRFLFFEAVKAFERFAVLSKVDPIEIDQSPVSPPARIDPATNTVARGPNWGPTTEISQTETIYLMDTEGSIKPYLKIIATEVDGVFYDISKTKNKMIDEDLLEEFIGLDKNKKLVVYAKENKLSFKRKSDLIKILRYYSELLN